MYEVRPLEIVPALTIELNIRSGCEIIVWRGAEVKNHVLKISNPAPSLSTKPSRFASNGRLAFAGWSFRSDNARMF